jgi:hypothetical protein
MPVNNFFNLGQIPSFRETASPKFKRRQLLHFLPSQAMLDPTGGLSPIGAATIHFLCSTQFPKG